MTFSAIDQVELAFAVAVAGAFGGLWMSALPHGARIVISFSGGLLAGVALFGLLPELVQETGWWSGLPVFAAGYGLLFWLDRRWHPHVDGHAGANGGFTVPLLIAASIHAFLDGWGLASLGMGASSAVRLAFPVAIIMHKAPEGLALGAIFRAMTGSRWLAIGLCGLAEAATFAGAWAGDGLTPRLGSAWTNYPLAVAGGCFLYLGYHAVVAEWKRFGAKTAGLPALLGFVLAAVIQSGVRLAGI